MTTFRRGQVLLVRLPVDSNGPTIQRPAVVLHPSLDADVAVSVLPLVPRAQAGPRAMAIERGTFESARMGLVTTLYLDPDIALDLPRVLVSRVTGQCPYVLLDEVMRRRRSPLASAVRDAEEMVPRARPLRKRDADVENEEAAALPAAQPVAIADAESPATPDAPSTTATEPELSRPAEVPVVTSLPSAREDFSNRFTVKPASYTCLRTPAPVHIDGDITKAVWRGAPVSDAFVDIVKGTPVWFDTRVRLLWDDEYLYFGFTAEETDVWGTLTERDSKVYEENDLEIFIAGQNAYYEFEISACNVIYEAFWIWKDVHQPGGPYWGRPEFNPATERTMTLDGVGGHIHPRGERWGFLDWDCPGLLHAVKVDGTLNERNDTDFGWSAEIAIPWASLALLADGRSLPPKPGDVWRIDCSRFQKVGEDGELLDPCAGFTWNQHGHYDSHIPELFPHVTFSDDQVTVDGVTET